MPVCKLLSGWTYSMKCVCCNAGERKRLWQCRHCRLILLQNLASQDFIKGSSSIECLVDLDFQLMSDIIIGGKAFRLLSNIGL